MNTVSSSEAREAEAGAIAADFLDLAVHAAPEREVGAGEHQAPSAAVDEADAGLEPVFAERLAFVLPERGLQLAVQLTQDLGRVIGRRVGHDLLEQAPDDQGHERARHAVPGAIAQDA